MPGRVLQVVAVGNPPLSLMKDLEEPLLAQLSVTMVLGKNALPTPSYAFNKDRNQYHSNAIMRRLTPLLEPGQSFVLGVADVDLFVPDAPFVFLEADRESKVGLISIFRTRVNADSEVLKRRTQLCAVHAAGHLIGLSYCEDSRCVMFLATSVSDVDRQSLALCNLCRNELAKLARG